MQIHLSSLLLLPLSIAFAHPTGDSTSILPLGKRDSHGWIGSFADDSCSGSTIGHRLKLNNGDCMKFKLENQSYGIGIHAGSGWNYFTAVTFFTDENCKELEDDHHTASNLGDPQCVTKNKDVMSVRSSLKEKASLQI